MGRDFGQPPFPFIRLLRRPEQQPISTSVSKAVADPNLKPKEEGGGGNFVLPALPTFLPSMISCFFTQNKGAAPQAPPLNPSYKAQDMTRLVSLRGIIQISQ